MTAVGNYCILTLLFRNHCVLKHLIGHAKNENSSREHINVNRDSIFSTIRKKVMVGRLTASTLYNDGGIVLTR